MTASISHCRNILFTMMDPELDTIGRPGEREERYVDLMRCIYSKLTEKGGCPYWLASQNSEQLLECCNDTLASIIWSKCQSRYDVYDNSKADCIYNNSDSANSELCLSMCIGKSACRPYLGHMWQDDNICVPLGNPVRPQQETPKNEPSWRDHQDLHGRIIRIILMKADYL